MTFSGVEVFATIGGVIIVNTLIWVFLWGKRQGSVNSRLDDVERKVVMKSCTMYPECLETFGEIKEHLSNLDGKIEVLLLSLKEIQKNGEKEHFRGQK